MVILKEINYQFVINLTLEDLRGQLTQNWFLGFIIFFIINPIAMRIYDIVFLGKIYRFQQKKLKSEDSFPGYG